MAEISFLCVVCVAKVGVGRAEWAAIYRGDDGYCPEHVESAVGAPFGLGPNHDNWHAADRWCHDCQSRHCPRPAHIDGSGGDE